MAVREVESVARVVNPSRRASFASLPMNRLATPPRKVSPMGGGFRLSKICFEKCKSILTIDE